VGALVSKRANKWKEQEESEVGPLKWMVKKMISLINYFSLIASKKHLRNKIYSFKTDTWS